jgi:Zn-dependent peptidase ImmA (M78 family)
MNKPTRRDHSTRPTSERVIKEVAEQIRAILDPYRRSDFNIVDGIKRLTQEALFPWGKLIVKFFSMKDGDAPAYVVIGESKTLYVDNDIWNDAALGEPKARYILAHELGHLILHDHYAQPYSDQRKTVFQEEASTEWQAHRFAEHFLIRDCDLDPPLTPRQIALSCSVETEVVRRRFGRRFSVVGDFCAECGGSTVRVDSVTRCDSCGTTWCN